MSDTTGFFLSRQPIVTSERRLLAWELTLGSGDGVCLAGEPGRGTEYLAALNQLARSANWEALLGGARAVVRLGRGEILSELLEVMPRNRILVGLSPDFEVDAGIQARLHSLHGTRGTSLLFFGYDRRDPREQLIDLTEAVEVDTESNDAATQEVLVRRAQRRKLHVLAQSVDTDASFQAARQRGFDWMQGLHYRDASSDETVANPGGRVLLDLLLDARSGLAIDTVTQRVEANGELAEALLRLVNSLALARAHRIETVGQALIMIGANGLTRWLNLLLFQIGGGGGQRGALFRVAASRARLMELIALEKGPEDPAVKEVGETAFLVGILSLVHVLLGQERSKAIEGLSIPDEVESALKGYRGELGRLLRFSECLDEAAFPEVAEIARELSIDPVRVGELQSSAYEWVNQML